jgi:hypothetical protein
MATLVPINLQMLAPCLKQAGFDVEFSWFWKNTDYEGFGRAVLGRDATLADCH